MKVKETFLNQVGAQGGMEEYTPFIPRVFLFKPQPLQEDWKINYFPTSLEYLQGENCYKYPLHVKSRDKKKPSLTQEKYLFPRKHTGVYWCSMQRWYSILSLASVSEKVRITRSTVRLVQCSLPWSSPSQSCSPTSFSNGSKWHLQSSLSQTYLSHSNTSLSIIPRQPIHQQVLSFISQIFLWSISFLSCYYLSLRNCYGLNSCWSPNALCDGIRRWGLWEVGNWVQRRAGEWSLHDGISAL